MIRSQKYPKHNKRVSNSGFTLIEMVISIAIIAVIATVIILNQNDFNKSVKLQNLGHQIATLVRDTQSQAVNVNQVGYDRDLGIGIYYPGSGKTLTLYAVPPVDSTVIRSDYQYDHVFSGASTILDQVTIPNEFQIAEVCIKNTVNPLCASNAGYSVSFVRPSLQAHFSYNDTELVNAEWLSIKLSPLADSSISRFVIINQSGLIYTSNEKPSE